MTWGSRGDLASGGQFSRPEPITRPGAVTQLLLRTGLRFENPAEEGDYRTYRSERLQFVRRVGLLLSLGMFGLFGIWDIYARNWSDLATKFRFLIALPLLGVSALIVLRRSRSPEFESYLTAYTFLLTTVAAGQLLLLSQGWDIVLVGAFAPLNAAMALVLFTCVLSLAPVHAAASASSVLFAHVLYSSMVANHDPLLVAGYSFNLLGIAAIGVFVACSRDLALRAEYQTLRRTLQERDAVGTYLAEVLPRQAQKLESGAPGSADSFGEVAILFADLVGFTALTSRLAPKHLLEILDRIFSEFDALVDRHGVEKVKTIGDSYMVIGGVTGDAEDATLACALLGQQMIETVRRLASELGHPLDLRVGLHSGSVIGGVIGRRRAIYDYWGDTVNIASRMESTGLPGTVQVSEAAYWRLRSKLTFGSTRTIDVKGKGILTAYPLATDEN